MNDVVFELCAETLDACLAARLGGAHRIELCSALSEGGLTPDHGLIGAAVRQSGLPVHVMLRPRGGNFLYSPAEFEQVRADLLRARDLGAQGFVAGMLDAGGRVDLPRMQQLVHLAQGLEVTFHRAFEMLPDPAAALEQVIACGFRRLLTSGPTGDVRSGAEALHALNRRADGRIVIAAGGGLRRENAALVAATSGLQHFHGSMRGPDGTVQAAHISAVIAELRRGAQRRA